MKTTPSLDDELDITYFKEGDLVRFWTIEECAAHNERPVKEIGECGVNWGAIGEVGGINHVGTTTLYHIQFDQQTWNRNIGPGALTLIKSYDERVIEKLGEDYA